MRPWRPPAGPWAHIVANAIQFAHERNYILDTWCVMPAHRIRSLLHGTGAVWEREYFDRLVRSGQTESVRSYILNNPRKANLTKWPWYGSIVAGETPALRKP